MTVTNGTFSIFTVDSGNSPSRGGGSTTFTGRGEPTVESTFHCSNLLWHYIFHCQAENDTLKQWESWLAERSEAIFRKIEPKMDVFHCGKLTVESEWMFFPQWKADSGKWVEFSTVDSGQWQMKWNFTVKIWRWQIGWTFSNPKSAKNLTVEPPPRSRTTVSTSTPQHRSTQGEIREHGEVSYSDGFLF